MGLQDRDYMRRAAPSRPVRASGPPEPSAGLTLLMIILCIGATYGAYAAWRWWQPPPVSVPVPMPIAPARLPPPQSTGSTSSEQSSSPQPSARNQNAGLKSREVAVPASRADSTVRITKCVVNGVTSYSDGECPPQADRSTITVDARQNLVDGLPRTARSSAQPPAAPQQPIAAPPSVADDNVDKKSLCLHHEAEIKAIDARARQPLSGWEQDRLAARRKAVRDEQFRLRC